MASGNKRKAVGALGENIAADHLQKLGFRIHERNVCSSLGEIDIVAQEGNTLAFVEVRTRQGNSFGTPEESITARKKRRLCQLAESYLERCDRPFEGYRIDVVVIELTPAGIVRRIELIRNAVEAQPPA